MFYNKRKAVIKSHMLVFLVFAALSSLNAQTLERLLSKPDNWYKSEEAISLADNILLFQRNTGGWPKGYDYFKKYTAEQQQAFSNHKRRKDSTFDNQATYTELKFLARAYTATGNERYRDAFNRGLDMIFDAQYENGGWPQYYPESHIIWNNANSKWCPEGIEYFITFNDNAMTGILFLLRNASLGHRPFAFVDEGRKTQAKIAIEKGIRCILDCQFIYEGKKTIWPAQVDEKTFAPKWGRSFEPPSVCASESVGVIQFLMTVENPSEEIINSIQSAVKWLDDAKILNTRLVAGDTMTIYDEVTGRTFHGRSDHYIVEDKKAPPLWARFYELNTFRPIFSSRDDKIWYRMSDISLERRSGYSWYGYWPESLLSKEYPEWCKKNKVNSLVKHP